MRIVLGGVRGSSPRSHPDFMRFGGATSSVLVENDAGARVVLDAGTGLRTLLPYLESADDRQPVLMLFTHYHLDHLIGLPPFPPLYNPEWGIVFAAPVREGVTVEAALKRLTDKPFWPAPFRARQHFIDLPEESDPSPFSHGPFVVRWCAVHHRNGCHAYRIEAPQTGETMAVVTDLELAASDEHERAALFRLCREPTPVDVLVMEGHGEASRFADWGHSTWPETIGFAKAVEARQLVITHHAPDDDDMSLSQRQLDVQALMPNACLGCEGMTLVWKRGESVLIARERA